jgi:hypothetical protein
MSRSDVRGPVAAAGLQAQEVMAPPQRAAQRHSSSKNSSSSSSSSSSEKVLRSKWKGGGGKGSGARARSSVKARRGPRGASVRVPRVKAGVHRQGGFRALRSPWPSLPIPPLLSIPPTSPSFLSPPPPTATGGSERWGSSLGVPVTQCSSSTSETRALRANDPPEASARSREASRARPRGARPAQMTALRLYTGPLYVLYNALLRGFPGDVVRGLAGNRYETTILVIVSGISKLSRTTPIPVGRRLYRGLSGMLLPEAFWRDREGRGFLGGVEMGLMSTTADRNIAIQYSGLERRRAAVFEIHARRRGDVCWPRPPHGRGASARAGNSGACGACRRPKEAAGVHVADQKRRPGPLPCQPLLHAHPLLHTRILLFRV